MPADTKDEDVENYGNKEKGWVKPYDDYINEMISYIDQYATDEPTIDARRKMLKDAQVKAVVETIKEAVLSAGWEIHYDFEVDKELGTQMVAFLYESFNRINEAPWSAGGIEDLIEKWMDALWYKKMTCELVYGHDKVQEYIFVRKAKVLPPESVRHPCDHLGNLLAVEQYPYNIELEYFETGNYARDGVDAVKLDMNQILLWINGDDYSRFEGKSELDPVYKYWFLKDFILKFWSMFIERFGAPLLIAFVKAKHMKSARDSLKNIITETSFTMADGDKVEVIEPTREGDVFKMMISYCDNEITKGLLMPTAVFGDMDGGSKQFGELQFKFFEYRIGFIQRKIQNLTRALIKKEIDLNFPNVKHYPVFTFKPISITQRRMMAQTFDLLVKNALIHPLEPWVRRELQLPEISEPFLDDLDEAWKAKMTAGSQAIITTPVPVADITRTEAQVNQRESKPVGEGLADDKTARIEAQFDDADRKFADFLVPLVHDEIRKLVREVEKQLKADKSLEFAKTPSWLKNLKFELTGVEQGFTNMYDEILVDITLGDNTHLTSLGMESAFDVRTRTGAFNWIEKRMADIRSGLIDYGSVNARDLELRILADTKAIVQDGLDEGLRGRDITKNLEKTMLGKRYNRAQLETIVRTNTTAIVNQGKKGFARANTPFVKGMTFLAILDDGTTDICRELDGKEFAIDDPNLDKYTPPLDYNCRSVLDYIIEGSPTYNSEGVTTEVAEGFGDEIYAVE